MSTPSTGGFALPSPKAPLNVGDILTDRQPSYQLLTFQTINPIMQQTFQSVFHAAATFPASVGVACLPNEPLLNLMHSHQLPLIPSNSHSLNPSMHKHN